FADAHRCPFGGIARTRTARSLSSARLFGEIRQTEARRTSRSFARATYQKAVSGGERTRSAALARGRYGTARAGSSPAASVSKTTGHPRAFGARTVGAEPSSRRI